MKEIKIKELALKFKTNLFIAKIKDKLNQRINYNERRYNNNAERTQRAERLFNRFANIGES